MKRGTSLLRRLHLSPEAARAVEAHAFCDELSVKREVEKILEDEVSRMYSLTVHHRHRRQRPEVEPED